jgi:hypothetical protein
MVVTVSSARFVSHCLFPVCWLYLGPLFNRSNSVMENVMSLLLTTLGKKGWGFSGLVVCCWVSLSNLLSRVLYLDLIVVWRLSSVRSWMYGRSFPHMSARERCRLNSWWFSCCFFYPYGLRFSKNVSGSSGSARNFYLGVVGC